MQWKYYNPKFEYEEDFQDIAWPWVGHKKFAYDLTINIKPKIIVELGTHKGTSLFSFAQAAKDDKIDVKINAIDTWEGEKHAGFYDESIIEGVKKIQKKYYSQVQINLLQKTFDEAVNDFENNSIDILHIDGLHTYDAIKHDFNTWIQKVADDGIVLFHDIEVSEDDFGVYKFWNELKEQYKTIEFHQSFGLGVLFLDTHTASELLSIQDELQKKYSYSHEMDRIKYINDKEFIINGIQQDVQQKERAVQLVQQDLQETRQDLRQTQQVLRQTQQDVQQRDCMIQQMQLSKFWKLRNAYIHYKKGLRESVKNPFVICVFLKKRLYKIKRHFFETEKLSEKTENMSYKSYDTQKKENIITVETMLAATSPFNIVNIDWIASEEGGQRLNIVTDSISKESLFGGVATSLILATLFANRYQLPLRIITLTKEASSDDYIDFLKMINIPIPKNITFFFNDAHNIENHNKLEVIEGDIFLATSWWSARVIDEINRRKNFLYILQEVESFFYPNGDEQLACNQVLEQKNIKYILNTKVLFEYFKNVKKDNVVKNGCFFEPAFPQHMYAPGKKQFIKKTKKNLFFYARPHNKRNLFYTGLRFIDKSIREGILKTDEWNIYFAGSSDIQDVTFSDGTKPIFLGHMNWSQYQKFAQTIDLAVCLMYTPHPSYPPLDIIASGGVVLTNKYENKKILPYSDNIILTDLDDESFIDAIARSIELAKNLQKRKENYENNNLSYSWDESFESALEFMHKNI